MSFLSLLNFLAMKFSRNSLSLNERSYMLSETDDTIEELIPSLLRLVEERLRDYERLFGLDLKGEA